MGTHRIYITRKNEKKITNKHKIITKLTLPILVSKQNKKITMYIEIFYVKGILFFL